MQVREEDAAAAERVGRDRERQREREMQRMLRDSEDRRLAAEKKIEEMQERHRKGESQIDGRCTWLAKW